MAAYIKTLYDSTGTDILYPQTKATAVYTEENINVETALQNKLTTPTGNQGQLLGFTANNIVGAVDAPSGIDVQTSAKEPSGQKTGDFWYQIV